MHSTKSAFNFYMRNIETKIYNAIAKTAARYAHFFLCSSVRDLNILTENIMNENNPVAKAR